MCAVVARPRRNTAARRRASQLKDSLTVSIPCVWRLPDCGTPTVETGLPRPPNCPFQTTRGLVLELGGPSFPGAPSGGPGTRRAGLPPSLLERMARTCGDLHHSHSDLRCVHRSRWTGESRDRWRPVSRFDADHPRGCTEGPVPDVPDRCRCVSGFFRSRTPASAPEGLPWR